MNQSFNRKIVYLVALAALLWPMAWLGSPSTVSDPEGGKLAQLRSEARLGQADLGAIDPASETIRMATLGLRGMAVTMLWNKANQYKKVEDWDAFQATLDQLSRLQPYFVKVWQYQAWNLTYNVSVELDDVRDRFYYVKRGIFYLKDGIQYLRDNPTLLDDLGWFTGNKVGRADEHELYRRMFKADDELHAADTQSQARDNWLVSRQWYELAISAVEDRGQPLGTKNPVTFFDSPARSQMSYAEAIEEEGVQNSLWRSAWELGGELWHDYATREMRATQGFMVRLADQEKYEADMRRYADELDALRPGMSDVLRREAEAGLSDKQKELLAAPPANPTPEEATLSQQATEALDITPAEVAARIAAEDPDKASAARKLANQILAANERARSISTDRDVANYAYWESRCKIEQTDAALNARRLAHEGRRAFQDEGDLDKAREKYEACFVQWAEALKAVPEIGIDSTFGGDLMEFVDDYHKVLQQLDLSLSDKGVAENFALWNVVQANDNERTYADDIEAYLGRSTGLPEGLEPAIKLGEGLVP